MDDCEIKFYFDFKSPFTYLAFEPACDLERSHRVRLRLIPYAVDLQEAYGGDLEQRDEMSWRKVRYLYEDARRFANDRGLTIRGPRKLFDSRLSLIAALYAQSHGRLREFCAAVFELFFKRELDLEDRTALEATLAATGTDPGGFLTFAEGEGARQYANCQAEAEGDNVFGVPMLIVEGEPFWGNDRIAWVIKKLDREGLRR